MFRRGDVYTLTYDDSDLPSHYGWKISSRLEKIESRYNQLNQVITVIKPKHDIADLERHVRKIIADLDEKGRWISTYQGKRLTGQPKFKLNTPYISSEVFSRNIETLSEYIIATHKN
jgi:hypothetical protein